MNILHTKNKKKFVAYYKLDAAKKKVPYVIFHHGLMSDMGGAKALYIEKYCKQQGYNFIRFDNFGHGLASGRFVDETVSSWFEGLNLVINKLAGEPILLVGSSMGSWITLLSAIKYPEKIIGMVGISSAPDFTEELIWNKITVQKQNELKSEGIAEVSGTDSNCSHVYPISYNLILDGRKHLLLTKKHIRISCPVHLIHGMKDIDVPYSISQRLAEKIVGNKVVIKLFKDASHSLSSDEDLQIICNSIEEVLCSQV